MESERRAPQSGRAFRATGFWAWTGLVVGTLIVASVQATGLWRLLRLHERPPLWDMAENGWLALRLALDLEQLQFGRFLLDANAHDPWPFGYSLLQLPGFLLLGHGFPTAVLPQLVCYVVTPVAMVVAAHRTSRGAGSWFGAALAVALWLTSPLVRVYSILVMRELAGACVGLLVFVFYLRARHRDSLAAWRLAAAGLVFLFLIKPNYAIPLGLGLAVCEWRHHTMAQRAAVTRPLLLWLRPWKDRNVIRRTLSVLAYGLAVAALGLGINVGGALYAILVVATGVALWRGRREEARAAGLARLRALPHPARATVELLVAPLWVWFLSPTPNHLRGLLAFLGNRSSELGIVDGLLFYPRILTEHAVAAGWLAAFAVVGTGLALWVAERGPSPLGALLTTTAVMLAPLLLHSYKLDRFLITSLPFLFLSAGLGIGMGLEALVGRRVERLRALAPGFAFVLVAVFVFPVDDYDVTRRYPYYSGDADLWTVARAAAEMVRSEERLGTLGTFDEVSPYLVAWAAHTEPGGSVELVRRMPSFPADTSQSEVAARTMRWLERRDPTAILIVETALSSAFGLRDDYRRHNLWQTRVIPVLDRLDDWETAAARSFPELGIDLRLVRRRTTGRSAAPYPSRAAEVAPAPQKRLPARHKVLSAGSIF